MNRHDPFLPEVDGPTEEEEGYPLGFKIAVGLTALYLLWRLGQGVAWLVSRLLA